MLFAGGTSQTFHSRGRATLTAISKNFSAKIFQQKFTNKNRGRTSTNPRDRFLQMSTRDPTWVQPFLTALQHCGIKVDAAAVAQVATTTVYRRMATNPEFKDQVEEALDIYADVLEREANRRAVEGVEEPVYQGGNLVGRKRVYSDSLLALLLKGRRKKVFADRNEITGADGAPLQQEENRVDAAAKLGYYMALAQKRKADIAALNKGPVPDDDFDVSELG